MSYASQTLRKDRGVALEAVRQTGHALAFASEDLQNDELLQPASVQINALAVEGSVAPICFALRLELSEPTILYQVVLGMGGLQRWGKISSDSSVGILAQELKGHMRSKTIYLVLPGSDLPVSPFLVQSPLRDFCVVTVS